jgi:hypothetical protein
MAAIASGLLSSMPISASRAPMAYMTMRRPSTTSDGALAHDAIIGRQIRLAFATIDDQGADLEAATEIELHRRRESGPAETDDAGGGGAPAISSGDRAKGSADRIALDPRVGAVAAIVIASCARPDGCGAVISPMALIRPRSAHAPAPRCCPALRRSADPCAPPARPAPPAVPGRRHAVASARGGVRAGQRTQRCVGRRALVVVGMNAPVRLAIGRFFRRCRSTLFPVRDRLISRRRVLPVSATPSAANGDRQRLHHQRFGRTTVDAVAAAGAGFANHVMDLFRSTENGIGRADLDATAAADAGLFGHDAAI